MIYILRNVHQKCFYNFCQEQDLYHAFNYNVQLWYQVTLLKSTSSFRNLPIIVTTSDTYSQSNIWINGSLFWNNKRNLSNISTTTATKSVLVKISLCLNFFVCFIMQCGKLFCRDINKKVLPKNINCSTICNKPGA